MIVIAICTRVSKMNHRVDIKILTNGIPVMKLHYLCNELMSAFTNLRGIELISTGR